MSEYTRTTRECSVAQLRSQLRQAILKYFQEHQLGDPQAETIRCCETLSTRKNTSKLATWLSGASDTTIYTGMVLTPEQLIWVHYGDQTGIRLNATDLKQIRAKFYTSRFTKDAGLQIAGYIGDASVRVRGYIAMEANAAAQKFCEEVTQAIAKVNPPAERGFFKWLRG